MIELKDGAGLARLKRKATGPTPDRKRSNETSYGRSNLVSFKKVSVNEKRNTDLHLWPVGRYKYLPSGTWQLVLAYRSTGWNRV